MKNKIRSILLALSAAAVLFSCGEAGVQVRVGDDFETTFAINGAGGIDQIPPATNRTTINQELREYGDILSDVEVTELVVSLRGYDQTNTGQIVLDITGSTFDTGTGFELSNTSTSTFTNTDILSSLATQIRNGELSIGLAMNADAPFGDDAFEVVITMSILATASEDVL